MSGEFNKQMFFESVLEDNHWPDINTQVIMWDDELIKVLSTKTADEVWMIEFKRHAVVFYFRRFLQEPPYVLRERFCFPTYALTEKIYEICFGYKRAGAKVIFTYIKKV